MTSCRIASAFAELVKIDAGWKALERYRSKGLPIGQLVREWWAIDGLSVCDMIGSVARHNARYPGFSSNPELFVFSMQIMTGEFNFQVKELAAGLLEATFQKDPGMVDILVTQYAEFLMDAEDMICSYCPILTLMLRASGLFEPCREASPGQFGWPDHEPSWG